jgi:hydrophobic/amphiphilic exporter-1 (mainly G- bacteria), HAE1 family
LYHCGRLPEGVAQLRLREVTNSVDAVLKNSPGIKGWVTIGGFSVLDSANLSNAINMFPVYDDWDKRPAGLTQAKIIGGLKQRPKSIRNATFAVIPPSPIPGLGQASGFQMVIEDRANYGMGELQKAVNDVIRRAHSEPGFLLAGFTTFSNNSPQIYLDIDRTMANSLGVTINDVFSTLQTYLGSSYVNQFNKFNQSLQVRMQAQCDKTPDRG